MGLAEKISKEIKNCKTVEEVEALRCFNCSNDGHWGWCDSPWIKCEYRDRIKEILGKEDYKYSSLKEQMQEVLR